MVRLKEMDEMDPKLDKLLGVLRQPTRRDSAVAERRRQAFIAEAADISREFSEQQHAPVHKARVSYGGLFHPAFNISFQDVVSTGLAVLFVIIGGGGLTLVSAQSSLPDQALYPVKNYSEVIRLKMARNSTEAFNLEMLYYNRRMQEIQDMEAAGKEPPDLLREKLNTQFVQTLTLIEKTDDPLTPGQVEQFHSTLIESEQNLSRFAETHKNHPADSSIHKEIQGQLNWVEAGIRDPESFATLLKELDGKSDLPPVPPAATRVPLKTAVVVTAQPGLHGEDDEYSGNRTGTPLPGGSVDGSSQPGEDNDEKPEGETKCLNTAGKLVNCFDDGEDDKPVLSGTPTPEPSQSDDDQPSYENDSEQSQPDDGDEASQAREEHSDPESEHDD